MHTTQDRRRFSDFELDLGTRVLRKSGIRVRLQDQPFQILAILLAQPGEIVTRDEFRARLWPEGTFVDFEHGLNAAIKRLRAALGDTADSPRFIETLPRRGYRFIAPIAPGSPSAAGEPASGHRRARLVVLPFANLSDIEQDYFTDGLTEEMIAQIGRHCAGRIGVLARTSCWRYKESTRAAGEIGQALQVDYLVEGSVRRDGDRVRITAKLIETKGETQLWAETYDRLLEDCLAVQADVASQIAGALTHQLLPSPIGNGPATRQPAAYQAFLRGRSFWNMTGHDGLEDAIRHYDRAIALDPEFGKAYSARARAGVALCEYYQAEPLTMLEGVRRDATRALELDPGDSEAMVALAEVHRALQWDWPGAEALYRAALDANPNSESTHRYYALYLACRRRDEALHIVDRGWELDPLCSVNNVATASVRFFAGDYQAAIDRCRLTLDMDPTFGPARRRLASALAQAGRYREALDEYGLIAARLDPVSRAWMGHTLAVSGSRPAARALAASLESAIDGQTVPPFHLAMLYAGLEEHDRAFQLLDRACAARDPWLPTLDVDPRFRGLRTDPRYADLLERLHLTSKLALTRG